MPLTFNIDDGYASGTARRDDVRRVRVRAGRRPLVPLRLITARRRGARVHETARDGRPRPTVRATVSYRARTEDGEAVIGDETMDVTDALDLLSDDAAHALLSPSWARREGVDRRAAEEALFKVANTLAGHETFDGGRLTLSEEDGHSDPVGYFTVRFGRE